MTYARRLAICGVASVAAHLLVASGWGDLPETAHAMPPVVLRVELREPSVPYPKVEPEAPAPTQPAAKVVHEARLRRTRRAASKPVTQTLPPKQLPPTERPATNDTRATPVFGLSMESTSSAGSGPSMVVGNTLQVAPRGRPEPNEAGAVRPLAAPVPAYEVTKMPLPMGDCEGKYTDAAREAGLEGTVIFDLVVDEHGRARNIKVVQGLGSGLTEAAKRALQGCAFSPGERDGKPVPVRIRSFKIRFRLRENE